MKKPILLLTVVLLALVMSAVLISCDATNTTTNTTDITTTEAKMSTTENTTTAKVTTTEATTTVPVTTATPLYSLEGKTFIFLGSSVTYGSASGGTSFVEYIAKEGKCTCIKEAVSGTTLVDNGSSSYIQRMLNNIDTTIDADHFICQLSTNDASQNKTLGRVSDSKNLEDFNTSTIIGAMEYIICYAKETWDCPVSFYTGTKYDSRLYERMIKALYDLQEKWDIGIIDLWNDEEMNSISEKLYDRYMSDAIHPTGIGYKVWWTPKFIEHLRKYE